MGRRAAEILRVEKKLGSRMLLLLLMKQKTGKIVERRYIHWKSLDVVVFARKPSGNKSKEDSRTSTGQKFF